METRTSSSANPTRRPSRSRWAGYVLANGLTLMLLAPLLSHMIADRHKSPESLYVPLPIDNSRPCGPWRYCAFWPYMSESVYEDAAPCENPGIFLPSDTAGPDSEDPPDPGPTPRSTPPAPSPPPPPTGPFSDIVDYTQRIARSAWDRMRPMHPWPLKVNIRVRISQPPGSSSPQYRVGPKAPDTRLYDLDASLRHVMLVDRLTASAWNRECLDFGVLIDASPDVGWTDVYRVVEICRNAGLQRIEFTAPLSETPAPPGQPERR